MFIDRMLWLRVRKAALDSGTTATEFVESALNEKLAKVEAAQERLNHAYLISKHPYLSYRTDVVRQC